MAPARQTEWQERLEALADEQDALRRVASLVARRAPPREIFDAVIFEAARVVGSDASVLLRYESDHTVTIMARKHPVTPPALIQPGERVTLEGDSAAARVQRTGRPARIESYDGAPGPLAERQRLAGYRSGIAAPVVVGGRLWGAIVATWYRPASMPADAERRLGDLTELLGLAIANADSRAELAASRARVALAADETRRRIERNLHDSTQQQLVSIMLKLRTIQASPPSDDPGLARALAEIDTDLSQVLDEVREIARGARPGALSQGGLLGALQSVAERSPLPVELAAGPVPRMAESVEVTTYYVFSEVLCNAAKHAGASSVRAELEVADGELNLTVSDDGVGGAEASRGSGLRGLCQRVEGLGGSLEIDSPRGHGTRLTVRLPLA